MHDSTTRYINHSILGMVVWQTPGDDPAALTHSHMWEALKYSYPQAKAVSAGYVSTTKTGAPYCHGNSIGLGLLSKEGDTELLMKALEGKGA